MVGGKTTHAYLWDDDAQNRFFPALILMKNQSARTFSLGKTTVTVDRDKEGVISVSIPGTLPAQFLTVIDAVNHLITLERIALDNS